MSHSDTYVGLRPRNGDRVGSRQARAPKPLDDDKYVPAGFTCNKRANEFPPWGISLAYTQARLPNGFTSLLERHVCHRGGKRHRQLGAEEFGIARSNVFSARVDIIY